MAGLPPPNEDSVNLNGGGLPKANEIDAETDDYDYRGSVALPKLDTVLSESDDDGDGVSDAYKQAQLQSKSVRHLIANANQDVNASLNAIESNINQVEQLSAGLPSPPQEKPTGGLPPPRDSGFLGNGPGGKMGLPIPSDCDDEDDDDDESDLKSQSPGSPGSPLSRPKISAQCFQKSLVFGGTFEESEQVRLPEYLHTIPAGLEGLWHKLVSSGGLNLEGIFRLRGKEPKLKAAKTHLTAGGPVSELTDITPIETAQLLKAWFRECICDDPGFVTQSLLDAQSEDDMIRAIYAMSEPRRSIVLWSFDMWIQVEKCRPQNKMTLQSMAIVFSPNFIRTNDSDDPMTFLHIQKEAQRVLQDASQLRRDGRLPFGRDEMDRYRQTGIEPIATMDLIKRKMTENQVNVELVKDAKKKSKNGSSFNLFKLCTVL